MILVLLGPSCSGKDTICQKLVDYYNLKKIVSYTTREKRQCEIEGIDYHFINESQFKDMVDSGEICEWEEYTQNRFYGTKKEDYEKDNQVVILTPHGLRQLLSNGIDRKNIFAVYIDASLGIRIVRYVMRNGTVNFDYDDKNELMSRLDRDYGMFLGIEEEVDFIVRNDGGAKIDDLVNEIIAKMSWKSLKNEEVLD